MDLETKRFFVSRDLAFHESMFPFAGKSKSCHVFPDSVRNLDHFLQEAPRSSVTTVPLSTSLTSPGEFPSLPTDSWRRSTRTINHLFGPRIFLLLLYLKQTLLVVLILFLIILITLTFPKHIKVF